MKSKNESKSLRLIRSIALGVLVSMVTFYLIHVYGEWRLENYRPDPETTSSIILHNNCAIFHHDHSIRPGSDTVATANDIDKIKWVASFMLFFEGHVIGMILFALVLGVLVFLLRNRMKAEKE